jgi:hypothetical protein
MPDVLFPVYVFAEDCGEVTAYQSLEAMQGYMEAIDVENDEYEAWDATGRVLQVQVGPSSCNGCASSQQMRGRRTMISRQ